jgi:energy-coupling factor transport system ATP-binding protein
MVFQYPEQQLFAETVFEDVAFGFRNFTPNATAEETQRAVKEAITSVGLNYENVKNSSPFELSGGQKRRVAIAGVIVTKPEILVLDEPAAGLDPAGKEEIISLLHDLHGKWCKTVIIVSHDMDEIAENCKGVAVFSGGKVVLSGTPQEIFLSRNGAKEAGLDLPFTAKATKELSLLGVEISSSLTKDDFIAAVLSFAKEGLGRWQNA